ncbi:type IV toxin-antitoxin system AbiEi family antitoxin domain-containing protein [Microbacterium xylanilyticum]
MDDIEVLRAVAGAPMRTVRSRDLDREGLNTWRTLARLVDQGALKKLIHGVYTAPPDGRDARTWKPAFEDAALAIAVARFGARNAALMGLTAARHWAALPRAIATAAVAVPRTGYPETEYGGGRIRFVARDMKRLDLVLVDTMLGKGLVTTPTQTLYDLLARPALPGLQGETEATARNLVPQADAEEFADIVGRHRRANDAVREMQKELEVRDVRG